MSRVVHGVVHGKIIELTEDIGVADGQTVEIVVRPVAASSSWGEGIRRSAGALADDWSEEDDRALDEIYRDRKRDSRRDIPE